MKVNEIGTPRCASGFHYAQDVDNNSWIGLSVLGIMAGYGKGLSTSAKYGEKLHEVTERICQEKIDSFVSPVIGGRQRRANLSK